MNRVISRSFWREVQWGLCYGNEVWEIRVKYLIFTY